MAIPACTGYRVGQDWTIADTSRQGAFITLLAADYLNTRCIAKHPDEWRELNPILGSHPSVSDVDKYFAFTGTAHTLIAIFTPPTTKVFDFTIHPRRAWQHTWIVLEAGTVAWNMAAGIKYEY